MRRLLPGLLCLLVAGAARAEGPLFLHELVVEDGWKKPLSPEAPVRLVLEGAEGLEQTVLARRWGVKAQEGTLTVQTLAYPPDTSRAEPRHRKPSFVLDYDEPAVAALLERARQELGRAPAPQAVARWVDAAIPKKSMNRGFDLASTVAQRGEGDCTEHAVLLAAVLRGLGHPARVATGLALLHQGGRTGAFGHAWVEVREKQGWRPVDAALPPGLSVVYLPLGVFEEEGPGFAFRALSAFGIAQVRRVRLEPKSP